MLSTYPMIFTLDPKFCRPPHRVTHPEKLDELIVDMTINGWAKECPKLVGYLDGKVIQLLSGSHRWLAAMITGVKVPVRVWSKSVVYEAYGDLDKWSTIMKGD